MSVLSHRLQSIHHYPSDYSWIHSARIYNVRNVSGGEAFTRLIRFVIIAGLRFFAITEFIHRPIHRPLFVLGRQPIQKEANVMVQFIHTRKNIIFGLMCHLKKWDKTYSSVHLCTGRSERVIGLIQSLNLSMRFLSDSYDSVSEPGSTLIAPRVIACISGWRFSGNVPVPIQINCLVNSASPVNNYFEKYNCCHLHEIGREELEQFCSF